MTATAPLPTITPSPYPSVSATPTSSSSATATISPPPTHTLTPLVTTTPTSNQVRINEIAWAGTLASAYDEWIELFNPGTEAVDLSGWLLTDGNDIEIILQGNLPANGYFLLERSDDNTIRDLPAHQIYRGGLNNTGETLQLFDTSRQLADMVNPSGGAWPAGIANTRASMQRSAGSAVSWYSYTGPGTAEDAAGNPIPGTPLQANSPLPTPSPTGSATVTPSASATTTATHDPFHTPTPFPQDCIWINEIAWAGSETSSAHEWIELHNICSELIALQGLLLTDSGDIEIHLSGSLPPQGFYLLERSHDHVINDIPADLLYRGSLRNMGETLLLLDPDGEIIDSANLAGGKWPAGHSRLRRSMERRCASDNSSCWGTFPGYLRNGYDALGNVINGTPRHANAILIPSATPTLVPGRLVINEVLMRPHYDWQGKGGIGTEDEFIEIYNIGPERVNTKGWVLDDIADGGSAPYHLPARTLKPGTFLTFFHADTGIALNDSGDTVRLLMPDGRVADEVTYLRVWAYNLGYGRLPDGSDNLVYSLWPTAGRANVLFVEPTPQGLVPVSGSICPPREGHHQQLARHLRLPAAIRAWIGWFFITCTAR